MATKHLKRDYAFSEKDTQVLPCFRVSAFYFLSITWTTVYVIFKWQNKAPIIVEKRRKKREGTKLGDHLDEAVLKIVARMEQRNLQATSTHPSRPVGHRAGVKSGRFYYWTH